MSNPTPTQRWILTQTPNYIPGSSTPWVTWQKFEAPLANWACQYAGRPRLTVDGRRMGPHREYIRRPEGRNPRYSYSMPGAVVSAFRLNPENCR